MYTYNFQERRQKIKLLQERAFELEEQREKLEDEGLNPLEVANKLESIRRELELGKEVTSQALRNPYTEDKTIIQNLGISNTGLTKSHHEASNTKTMYKAIEEQMNIHKRLIARKKARKAKK